MRIIGNIHNRFAAAILTLLAVSLHLTSCDDSLRRALEYAGDNRHELERVLEYYENAGDPQKLAAAEYLIANMPGHKSMTGDYERYYEECDIVISHIDGQNALDSLEAVSRKYVSKIRFENDASYLESGYLISCIEDAFHQWREGLWARHLNFDEFCETLLPYTVSNRQPLSDWRQDMKEYAESYIRHLEECSDYHHNPRAAVVRVNDCLISRAGKQLWVHSPHGYPIFCPLLFEKLPGARCDEYAEIAALIMRSKGIPVNIDFTFQWPDRLYGHYWCSFKNLRGRTSMFNPYSTNPDYPHYSHAEFAKVFRRTYAPERSYLRLLRRHEGDVPLMSQDVFFKDVTDEYEETSNLKVKLLDGTRLSDRDVYISVFDNSEWKPVFWGRAWGGKARFRNMGRNVMYIVLGKVKGLMRPVSLPFILKTSGEVEYISPGPSGIPGIRMTRKYPMLQHVMRIQADIHGGVVVASSDKNFENADTVCAFPEWELTSGRVPVRSTGQYRYWRFLADDCHERSDMAELYFFDSGHNLIRMSADSDSSSFMLDGDPLTYYTASSNSAEYCLDAGHPVTVSQISYVRRGDGNAIIPGDKYRISVWNIDGWKVCQEIVARDVDFIVEGLPSGGLYFIEGLSRGVQNRIFLWDENENEIVWY